jgi:hypothetical protein
MNLDDYQCVMVRPKRPMKLKPQKYTLQQLQVVGFTRNGERRDVPNGIEFTMIRVHRLT